MRWVCLLVLVACHSTPPPARPVSNSAPPAPAAPPPRVLLASLERGMCYGWCPVYRVEIYRDGTLAYHGEHFVKTRGDATGHVTPAQLAALDQLFASAHYFDLADRYDEDDVTDAPTATTSYRLGDKQKSIHHYYGDRNAPEDLAKVEDGIDRIIGIEQWIGSEAEREQHHDEWR